MPLQKVYISFVSLLKQKLFFCRHSLGNNTVLFHRAFVLGLVEKLWNPVRSYLILLFHSLHGVGMRKIKSKCYITFWKCGAKLRRVPSIAFAGDALPFREHGIDFVLLFLIGHDNFLKRFVPKLGCSLCVYSALPSSFPYQLEILTLLLLNPHHMDASNFLFTRILLAVLRSISLSIISVWCCWAEVWVKWHNFKPDLSFWCTLVYFNVRIKHGLVFFFCFFSWQDLRLVISTREMIFPENLWAAQGHGLAESCSS